MPNLKNIKLGSGAILILCLAVFINIASAKENNVSVRASVNKRAALIGDRIIYRIEVKPGKDTIVTFPVFKDNLIGDFEIKDAGTRISKGFFKGKAITRWYEISSFSAGKHLIPATELKFKDKEAKDWSSKKTDEFEIKIESVLPKDKPAQDIKDIKGPIGFFSISIWAVLILSAFLASIISAIIIYRRIKHRARIKTPYDLAMDELEALKTLLAGSQDAREYYSRASDCVRRYIESVFHVRAPEMTTEEFLPSMSQSIALSTNYKDLLNEFLLACDLVKFAKYRPTPEEKESIYSTAKKFIEETKGYAHI